MKIVITGAIGHIGSRVIRELPLIFPGAEIIMIDNMMTQRYSSLFNLSDKVKYRFFEDDVTKMDLKPVIERADAVLHLAAITDAAGSFDKKEELERNNFQATKRVADVCCSVGSPMIHLSSTSVYGTQEEVVDEDCSLEELQPQSPYAETKLREEDYLKELGKTSGLRFTICRFGTISGISPGMRFHTAVNKFCWQAIMGQPITVWKTALHQKRPYLALDDAIRAFCHIIKNSIFDNRVYNVLTDNLTVNDIVNSISEKIPNVTIKFVETEIMNQLSYDVSNERFKATGFKFEGCVKKNIAETVERLKNANNLN
ncbi:MAG: SDR family oxidoreductase [Crocinitomicaceae bacterium]|nr:SDR family oxidoreductase [Crocinitomicaceae bacterium]